MKKRRYVPVLLQEYKKQNMGRNSKESGGGCGCGLLPFITNILPATITAMIGYNIHSNLFYAILDFFFWPIAWVVWLIGQDVNMSVVQDTFSFFFT